MHDGDRQRVKVRSWVGLLFLGVVNLHGLGFALAAILVVLHGHVGGVRHFDYLAEFFFHSGHHLVFAGVGERLGCGVIGAIHRHDPGAHAIDPSGNEFLFRIVVTVHRHAGKIHVLHLAIGAGHLEFAVVLAANITAIHDYFSRGGAGGLGRLSTGVHPHFYGVNPGAGGTRPELVGFVLRRAIPHLLHLLRRLGPFAVLSS